MTWLLSPMGTCWKKELDNEFIINSANNWCFVVKCVPSSSSLGIRNLNSDSLDRSKLLKLLIILLTLLLLVRYLHHLVMVVKVLVLLRLRLWRQHCVLVSHWNAVILAEKCTSICNKILKWLLRLHQYLHILLIYLILEAGNWWQFVALI